MSNRASKHVNSCCCAQWLLAVHGTQPFDLPNPLLISAKDNSRRRLRCAERQRGGRAAEGEKKKEKKNAKLFMERI